MHQRCQASIDSQGKQEEKQSSNVQYFIMFSVCNLNELKKKYYDYVLCKRKMSVLHGHAETSTHLLFIKNRNPNFLNQPPALNSD